MTIIVHFCGRGLDDPRLNLLMHVEWVDLDRSSTSGTIPRGPGIKHKYEIPVPRFTANCCESRQMPPLFRQSTLIFRPNLHRHAASFAVKVLL